MANDPEFGRRLRDAKRAWERTHDRTLTWDEVGALVARAMGRAPFAGPVVYRWFEDGREPKDFLAAVRAMAVVFETTPGALAFGEGAPSPTSQPAAQNGDAAPVLRPDDRVPDGMRQVHAAKAIRDKALRRAKRGGRRERDRPA